MDDVPNSAAGVLNGGAGFKTSNAYFYGADKLNALDYTKTEVCVGYRATTDGCPRVKCYEIFGYSIQASTFSTEIKNGGFDKPMSKVIACMAGAGPCTGSFMTSVGHGNWRLPIGHPGDPAPMDVYGEATTGNLVWSCGGYSAWTSQGANGWHFQGWGYTGDLGSTTNELRIAAEIGAETRLF